MKTAFTIFIISSFIGISIFGFLAMNHDMNSGHGIGCLAATVSGGSCTPDGNLPLAAANFHLNTLKSFSSAPFGISLSGILALLVLAMTALAINFAFGEYNHYGILKNTSFYIKRREFIYQIFKMQVIDWLAFHENSPASVRGA